jgi:hypothetical protein
MDARRGAKLVTVPFNGFGDEFAIAVAGEDICEHHIRQGACFVQSAATSLDRALFFQLFEDALQPDLVGAPKTKGTRDFPFANFGRMSRAGFLRRIAFARDEGEDILARGKGRLALH